MHAINKLKQFFITNVLLLAVFGEIKAQVNLVPNPSFESYTACPTIADNLSDATGWSSYRGSCDYFNSCAPYGGMSTPKNPIAFQFPKSGNSYAGFITYEFMSSDYREILGTQLLSPLQIGTKYYFSFFVSFAGTQNYSIASKKIGLKFLTQSYSQASPIPLSNSAHFYTTNIISDSLNWTQIKGSFLANMPYQFLAIGNFFDDVNMFSTDTISTAPNYIDAYYFIDDIRLSTDSNFAYLTGIQEKENNSKNNFYPVPCSQKLHFKNNGDIKKIEIYNQLGALAFTKDFDNDTNQEIDLASLENGFYILKCFSKEEIFQKHILILH